METPVPNALSKGRRYLKRRNSGRQRVFNAPYVPAKKGSAEQENATECDSCQPPVIQHSYGKWPIHR